ncbi:MAG: FKBP-type peptidyl-prolyl cis-trans isomerase [Bacteroidota bacterium]
MKTIRLSGIILLSAMLLIACKKVSYKKTNSGLAYKLYPGKGKDSAIKAGDVVKINYSILFNDSLMDNFSSYGKMPAYVMVQAQMMGKPTYDFRELIIQMRKGDSIVTVQMADSLLKEGSPLLPPHAQKGDRIITRIRIADVFATDSLARADYDKEMVRDRPRQLKEQEKEIAAMAKAAEEQFNREYEELKKSGEVDKEIKAMEMYLAGKKINARRTGKGTFVEIKEQGTGPAAAVKKYVLVKYTGKILATDSTFESNSYPLRLGNWSVIPGWEEGLLIFNEGGKGTLYIPGFLAYGRNPRPGSPFKPFDALKFDVELVKVSDTPIEQPGQ